MRLKQALPNPTGTTRQTVNLWPEFANIIGVGRNSVYAAARRGEFKTVRIGKKIVVSKAELRRLLGESEIPTVSPHTSLAPSSVSKKGRIGK